MDTEIARPDWYQIDEDESFSFAIARGEISDNDDTTQYISAVLQTGLLNPDHVRHLYNVGGKTRVEDYLATRGFATKLNTRVGDFGEVVAGALLESEESHIQPVRKLRYRETVDWAMRLTDVFTMRVDEHDEIDALCFTSVKSGINRPDASTATDGYEQLVVDSRDAHPEIIEFVSERLFELGEYESLERFDRMASRPEPVGRLYRLALVFDRAAWREDPLSKLDANLQPPLPEFKAYLLLATDLRNKVGVCYEHAADRCYPK